MRGSQGVRTVRRAAAGDSTAEASEANSPSAGSGNVVALLEDTARPFAGREVAVIGDQRTREEQVREDLDQRRADHLRRFSITAPVLSEYGRFFGSLTDWTHFGTLTHDPRRLGVGHSIVGHQRHRKQVRLFVRDDVRRLDRGAQWWSEMELHASGQCHEHALMHFSENAPVLSIRQRWYERCGYMKIVPITAASMAAFGVTSVAEYVAKYTGKAGAVAPIIAGFGLLSRESWSRVMPL